MMCSPVWSANHQAAVIPTQIDKSIMYGTSFSVLSFQPRLGLHVGFVCTQCLGKSILIDRSTAQTKSPPILNLYLIAKWYSTQHDIPVTKFCISILIFQEFVCLLYKSHLEEIKSLQQQDILHILFSKALHCSTVKVIGILNSQHDKFETQTWTHIVPGTPGNWLWRICA